MSPYSEYDVILGSRRRGSPIRLETASLTPCFQLKYPLLCQKSRNWVKVRFWVNFKLWIDFEVKIKVQHCLSEMQEPRGAECTATLENTSRRIKSKTNVCLMAAAITISKQRKKVHRHHLLSVRPVLSFSIHLSCDLLSATRVTFLKVFPSFCLFYGVLSCNAASISLPLNRRYLMFSCCFLLNQFVISKRKWLGSCDLRACASTQTIYTVFSPRVELRYLSYTVTVKNAQG